MRNNVESNLEMRCSDGAWYDGTLKVSANDKNTIIVHFNNFDDDEDETFSKWDIKDPVLLRSKVRVRSIQLQDSQCKLIYKDQKICGCLDDGEERKYYDAEIIEIVRKDHKFKKKGDEVCMCEFELYWIDGPRKGEKDKVGCDKVCTLNPDPPEEDPMIKKWLEELAEEERKLVKRTAPKGRGRLTHASASPSPSIEPPPASTKKQLGKSNSAKGMKRTRVSPSPSRSIEPAQTKKQSIEPAPTKKQLGKSTAPKGMKRGRAAPSPSRSPSPSIEPAPSKKKVNEPAPSKKQSTAPKGMKHSQSRASPSPLPSIEPAPLPKQVELAPLQKQVEPAPTQKQKLLELVKTTSVGSKKKRILQASGELADLQSDSAPKADNLHRSKEGHEEATGHDGGSDVAEQRVTRGGSVGNNGIVRAAENKQKSKVVHREGFDAEEVVREDVMRADIPSQTLKKQLKLKSTKIASPTEVAVPEKAREDMVTQTMAERVKLKKMLKAASDVVATSDKGDKQIEVTQTLAERVKLKTAHKSPVANAHKNSLQKLGKQVVGKQILKRKLIQIEDIAVDPLSSKFDKVSKRRAVVPLQETIAAQPKNVEPAQARPQRRKPGRPKRVIQVPEPAQPVTESTTTKMQQVAEISSARQQSPQEEVVHGINIENCSSDPPRNKTSNDQPQDEERLQHDNDGSSDTESLDLDAHDEKQPPSPSSKENMNHLTTEDHARVLPSDINTDLNKSPSNTAEDQEVHSHATYSNEAIEMPYHRGKISMAERIRDIQKKYGSTYGSSEHQAAQELISLAAATNPLYDIPPTNHCKPTSPASHQEVITSVPRRRIGKCKYVISDDEMDDIIVPTKATDQQRHGSDDAVDSSGQDECSPTAQTAPTTASDPKLPCSALDEEMAAPLMDSRMLVLENLEPDASALDAMELLQNHTRGVCAVHVLPLMEFHTTVIAYALYRDSCSARQALEWLASSSRFIVSPNGRPWIVSQSMEAYKPSFYGFAARTAFKSDDPAMCGIVSDEPHVHDLVVVSEGDRIAYFEAQQKIKIFEEHKKWRKELYERIVHHEKGEK